MTVRWSLLRTKYDALIKYGMKFCPGVVMSYSYWAGVMFRWSYVRLKICPGELCPGSYVRRELYPGIIVTYIQRHKCQRSCQLRWHIASLLHSRPMYSWAVHTAGRWCHTMSTVIDLRDDLKVEWIVSEWLQSEFCWLSFDTDNR